MNTKEIMELIEKELSPYRDDEPSFSWVAHHLLEYCKQLEQRVQALEDQHIIYG